MGNKYGGLSLADLMVVFIQIAFGNGVQRRGGFIQQHDGGGFVQSPRQEQFLDFTAGKFHPVIVNGFPELAFDPLRKLDDLILKPRCFQAMPDLIRIQAFRRRFSHNFLNGHRQNTELLKNR